MNRIPGPVGLLAMLDAARTDDGSPEPLPMAMLAALVELADARAVLAVGPDGKVHHVVSRPGTVLALDPTSLCLEDTGDTDGPIPTPGGWTAAGITALAVHRLPERAGAVVVAWDCEPDEERRARLSVGLAFVEERCARLRAEEQLADLTARVDNAQRLANMGDYDWHIATDTNRWSDQLYRIYGHEPQEFNASYDRFLAHIHPEDRERIQQIHHRAYETGEPYEMVERIVRPDGAVRFLSSNGQVVRDNTGTPVRMRGTCIDITDRVLAEQAKEHLAARLRSVVESCPDAILVLDVGGSIVQANRRAHELLEGDPVGSAIAAISPRLRAAGHDVPATTLQGRRIELDVFAAELRDVEGEGLVAVYLRDASLRHSDETRAAALREVQVRHRQALEINDDVVQGLTAAVLAMQQCDNSAATSYLERTLVAARRLMRDWSGSAGEGGVEPGSLVRQVASTLCPDPGPGEPPSTGGDPADRRILVVDDSADVRALLCAQLRTLGKGTVVGQAADGEQAIALAASLQPDLVLLDLSMPRVDGLQALPRILDAVDGVRVVVMSGFDERSIAEQVMAAGAARYVEKGLRMNLAAVIDEIFQAA